MSNPISFEYPAWVPVRTMPMTPPAGAGKDCVLSLEESGVG